MQLYSMLGEFDMKIFTAVVEKCTETGLYVGYVPGFPAHTLSLKHWMNSIRT